MVLVLFVLTHVTSRAEAFATDVALNSGLIPHVRHAREEDRCTHWIEAVRYRQCARGGLSGVQSHDGCLAPTSRGGAPNLLKM